MDKNTSKCSKMQHSLTPKQQLAVDLLATGMSDVDAAKELKIDRGTISRWREKEGFQQEIAALMTKMRLAAQRQRLADQQRLRGKIVPMAIAMLEDRLDPKCDYSVFTTSQLLQLIKMFGLHLPPEVQMVPESSSEQVKAPLIDQEVAPPSVQQMSPKTNGPANKVAKPKRR